MRFAEQLTIDQPAAATGWSVGEIRDGRVCGMTRDLYAPWPWPGCLI